MAAQEINFSITRCYGHAGGRYNDGETLFICESGVNITRNSWIAGSRSESCRFFETVEEFVSGNEFSSKVARAWGLEQISILNGSEIHWSEDDPFRVLVKWSVEGPGAFGSTETLHLHEVDLVIDEKSLSAERAKKRDFAKAQEEKLGRLGFSEEETRRIIAAAGPGQALAAARWVGDILYAIATSGRVTSKKTAWDAVLMAVNGALDERGPGRERREKALALLVGSDLPPEAGGTASAFSRFLRGARATLLSPWTRRVVAD